MAATRGSEDVAHVGDETDDDIPVHRLKPTMRTQKQLGRRADNLVVRCRGALAEYQRNRPRDRETESVCECGDETADGVRIRQSGNVLHVRNVLVHRRDGQRRQLDGWRVNVREHPFDAAVERKALHEPGELLSLSVL